VPAAGLVAFADLDGDLFVPAYRAAESALAMLVRASRLVGGRARGGAVLVQTRHPEHEVVVAALGADPSVVSDAEWRRRELLGFPPASTIAVVGRAGAPEYVERLGQPMGVQVQGPDDGQWLLRADHRSDLLDALARSERPGADLRLWVDPLRVR
jgi:primosomal protein N' (replication factor Y)